MYRLLHICNKRRFGSAGRRDAEARHATLQVDGYAQLLEEVHPENSVERAAARLGDRGQINRRQSDASQTMATQCELADRNFACIQCGCFIPGLDVDLLRAPTGE